MSIWSNTIADIVSCINGQSVYNTARTTTPSNLGLSVYNQAQDYLCMTKHWRDLRVDTQLSLDSDNAVTLPDDFGVCEYVYTDPSSIGKPMMYYYPYHADISRRYTIETTFDDDTGVRTIKFTFPEQGAISANPHVVYQKKLADATQAEVEAATKFSFFPKTLMLVTAKKMLQDYYGVPANQDPNWINGRVEEELKKFEAYAVNDNAPLDLTPHDEYGNAIFIPGFSLDGSGPRLGRTSPYLPSTLFTGGTM
jgi:hypothetical protein